MNAVVADRFREAAQRIGESLLTGIEINRGGLSALSVRTVGSIVKPIE